MKYITIWFFSVCWNFTLVWIIIIWWNIWIFDSFSYSEILMLLNHFTYLKNLMTMILYILYEILAFNKSLHIFEKFDDLILFRAFKYYFCESFYIFETLVSWDSLLKWWNIWIFLREWYISFLWIIYSFWKI